MFGGEGHGTGLHIDWARAVNLAIEVLVGGAAASGAAVALWLFIPPTQAALAAVSMYLEARNKVGLDLPPLFSPRAKKISMRGTVATPEKLTEAEMRAMAGDPALRAVGVYVLEQKSGEVVQVEPGWMHAVVNLRACIKIATDFVLVHEIGMMTSSTPSSPARRTPPTTWASAPGSYRRSRPWPTIRCSSGGGSGLLAWSMSHCATPGKPSWPSERRTSTNSRFGWPSWLRSPRSTRTSSDPSSNMLR
jgi:hypothetical protein